MSQWAEIRHMHVVDGVAKKEVARRLGLDVKTVRRALARVRPARDRASTPRRTGLDPYRSQIEELLRSEPRISAKRIARLLEPRAGVLKQRTVRRFVAKLRGALFPKEVFVHRTPALGDALEVDFGESWAEVGGHRRKVKYLVATLPACNAYFAKIYPIERIECLLDGIAEAFAWFGGVTRRVVLDNTSLAVRKVLKGTDRIETGLFHSFRGQWPFHADFCAPAKGWEKGSVERGVEYVRGIFFRPIPKAQTWDELNAALWIELDHDLDRRTLRDQRTIRQALAAEREHLRPLPQHQPETCRSLACVADKYGHVRVDRSTYSVPSRFARRSVTVNLFHDRVEAVVLDQIVARHARSFVEGAVVIDPLHVLALLEKKHRAASESTAILEWRLPEAFHALRAALRAEVRKPDKEWVQVLRLIEEYPMERVEAAVHSALEQQSARLSTVRMLLQQDLGMDVRVEPLALERPELAALEVRAPDLSSWDVLHEGGAR